MKPYSRLLGAALGLGCPGPHSPRHNIKLTLFLIRILWPPSSMQLHKVTKSQSFAKSEPPSLVQYLIAEPQTVNKMPQNWPRPVAYCWSLFAGFCNESPPDFCFTFQNLQMYIEGSGTSYQMRWRPRRNFGNGLTS